MYRLLVVWKMVKTKVFELKQKTTTASSLSHTHTHTHTPTKHAQEHRMDSSLLTATMARYSHCGVWHNTAIVVTKRLKQSAENHFLCSTSCEQKTSHQLSPLSCSELSKYIKSMCSGQRKPTGKHGYGLSHEKIDVESTNPKTR